MDVLARAALSNAILVSLLAVIVLAVDRFARRPALSHSLWLLLLLKLITPPLLPVSFNCPTASPRLRPAPVPIADTSRTPWAPALGPPVKAMERATGLEPTTSYSGLARGFA